MKSAKFFCITFNWTFVKTKEFVHGLILYQIYPCLIKFCSIFVCTVEPRSKVLAYNEILYFTNKIPALLQKNLHKSNKTIKYIEVFVLLFFPSDGPTALNNEVFFKIYKNYRLFKVISLIFKRYLLVLFLYDYI